MKVKRCSTVCQCLVHGKHSSMVAFDLIIIVIHLLDAELKSV